MNGDWLRGLTSSNDPAMNAAIAVFLVMAAAILIVVGGMFLLPVVLVIGIAKGVHWYAHRPTPTDQLYAQAQQRTITANFPAPEKFTDAYIDRFIDAIRDDPPAYQIYLAAVQIADRLYKDENLTNPLPPLVAANTIEEGRYRDQLIAHQRKTADAPRTLEIFNVTLGKCFLDFIAILPKMAKPTYEEFAQCDEIEAFATFPLVDVLPNAGAVVWCLILPFFREEVEELGLFTELRSQLDRNLHYASGVDYPAPSHKLVTPDQHKGTPREIVSAYLANTPFEALFYVPIPFVFTDERRFEHMQIVGGSGHGKTQLLQHLILHDLEREEQPSLIVIDSQGEMLRKIQNLKLFAEQPDRLVIIDPEQYSPALNMFDTINARAAEYSELHREQLQAGVIELYNYIFASIAAEMTSRQSTAFAFVARLMLSIPGATIQTLRELMEDPAVSLAHSPFREHIEKLELTARAYFVNQFFTRRYGDLKQQIARRLYGVLSVPAFDRMFSATECKLDMFDAMQSGKVVLVNTSKALLKSDASALFGRYVIALVIRAVFERVASRVRRPTYLIVDEASEYFDDNIQMLLEQARKFNVGIVLAHQHLDQLSTGLKSAIAANTAIKLAGGVNDRDARALASDMRTSPDFIASMQKHPKSTEFACYVRNATAQALRLTIPFGALEAAPTMSSNEVAKVVTRNRERYATLPDKPRPDEADPGKPPSETASVPTPAAEPEDKAAEPKAEGSEAPEETAADPTKKKWPM
jgi:Type IV secretion-system coupling protein DNA-binding domain